METLPIRQTQRHTPTDLLAIAIDKGADLEKLERLMELQERWEKNEARKAYVAAMAAFKADPPKIHKDKHVAFNQTAYDHASLANVTSTINSALSLHGLSSAWKTDQTEKQITVTCCITHVLGHQECTSLSAAADMSGGKNAIQGIGSTVSYLQRYSLLALTGLATHDMDTDGNSPVGNITESQAADLETLIADVGANKELFLKFMKIKQIEDMPVSQYERAVKSLEAKRKNTVTK